MKFNEYKYERPNFETISQEFKRLVETIQNSEAFLDALQAIKQLNKIQDEVYSMMALGYIRHTLDTRDEFYAAENDFWDEFSPQYEELFTDFYRGAVQSKHRSELEASLGSHYFSVLECKLKGFSPEIVEDLKEESRLCSQYSQLMASASFTFRGEELTAEGLGKYEEDPDRETRKEAQELYWSFLETHEDTIDGIFDQLVKVRDRMAKKLGYSNYVEMGYAKMERLDYGPQEVVIFRKQVLEDAVPLATKLFDWQRERLGLEKLEYFDLFVAYKDGNAVPKGSPEWIVEQGKKMYAELSLETKEFFDSLVERDLLDLMNRPGKEGGGHCWTIDKYEAPFIFANFNGTSSDIDVLTHEAGHAFQSHLSRHIEMSVLRNASYDAQEIHSMTMEFLTWPWMDNFFKEDTAKYKFSHLAGAIQHMPFGIVVDEFQHMIYENPNLSPKERKAKWRELERKYLPHKDYGDNAYLERGGLWLDIPHIFESPFYYIDYILAQVCALQFWTRMQTNDETAWNDYLSLCRAGGTQSFLGLIKLANLKSPFEEGALADAMEEASRWLEANPMSGKTFVSVEFERSSWRANQMKLARG